jgi:hypothetical protein
MAIGEEPSELRDAKAVYAGTHASEVTDPEQRRAAWRLLMQRHPNLEAYVLPEPSNAAMMRAECNYVSILDYSEGFGHTDDLTLNLAHSPE